MTSTNHASVGPSRSARISLWSARLLLGLLGLAQVYGSIYFSFFASPEEGGVVTVFDWFIAAWALLVGLGSLLVAILLGRRSPRYVQAATWVVVAHMVFGAIKLFGYGERESLVFLAVDVLILALLWLSSRPRTERVALGPVRAS